MTRDELNENLDHFNVKADDRVVINIGKDADNVSVEFDPVIRRQTVLGWKGNKMCAATDEEAFKQRLFNLEMRAQNEWDI